ncbi:MAG: hypothetical protein BWY21_00358 [Parcubacteria group bacterium ADurb.Bin216]|nr:MAG: hypothetical protein BWY21_00358 [Parcubacteria group bacterium ADurb.Bin216]
MLREVCHNHVKPRLLAFRTSQNSNGVNARYGYGDFTFARPSDGILTVTPREAFTRNSLIFGVQGGAGDGGYVGNSDATGKSSVFSLTGYDSAGNATDSDIDGVIFGWDSSDANLVKDQRVTTGLYNSRIIWGRVTGTTGAVVVGNGDFSVTRSGTGTYVVSYRRTFSQAPVVLVSGIATSTALSPRITNSASARLATGCTITLAGNSGSPADGDFYIVVIGQDTRSDSSKRRQILMNSQRKPRILGAQVTMASGTPSLTIGGQTGGIDFTGLTDNEAGDFSLTIAKPFARQPAVIVSTTTQRSQVHSYSNNVIRVLTKAANDTNTDVDGVTNILVIGSDDASEY